MSQTDATLLAQFALLMLLLQDTFMNPQKSKLLECLENLRANKPVAATALQFSGGEPTIRKDLFDFVRKAKELGFSHVEVNTNGLRLSQSVEYCKATQRSRRKHHLLPI